MANHHDQCKKYGTLLFLGKKIHDDGIEIERYILENVETGEIISSNNFNPPIRFINKKTNKDYPNGTILRYSTGPSALMMVDSSSTRIIGNDIIYYGEHYFGGSQGAWHSKCSPATLEEVEEWARRRICMKCGSNDVGLEGSGRCVFHSREEWNQMKDDYDSQKEPFPKNMSIYSIVEIQCIEQRKFNDRIELDSKIETLHVSVYPSEDVQGDWTGHVLESDSIAQAQSPGDAFDMAIDAWLAIPENQRNRPAPNEDWNRWFSQSEALKLNKAIQDSWEAAQIAEDPKSLYEIIRDLATLGNKFIEK